MIINIIENIPVNRTYPVQRNGYNTLCYALQPVPLPQLSHVHLLVRRVLLRSTSLTMHGRTFEIHTVRASRTRARIRFVQVRHSRIFVAPEGGEPVLPVRTTYRDELEN